jgi:hypothetical protein
MAAGAFAVTVQYWDYEDYDKYEYFVEAWEGNGTGFIGGFLIGVEDGDPNNYRNVQIRFGGAQTPKPTTWEIIPASEAQLPGIQTPAGSLSNGGVEPVTTSTYVFKAMGECCMDYYAWLVFEYTGPGIPHDTGWQTVNHDGVPFAWDDWSQPVGQGGPVWAPGIFGPRIQFDTESSGELESISPAVLPVTIRCPNEGVTYTVDYITVGGTAAPGEDYWLDEPGTLTFLPGETTKAISIDIVDDGLDEEDETIFVQLLNPAASNAEEVKLADPNRHTYTIRDPRPEVSFDVDSSPPTRENQGPIEVRVSLSFVTTLTVTVDYAATGGTATEGVDYNLLGSGTLTFDPGQTTRTISVQLIDDEINDEGETVLIGMSNAVNAKWGSILEHTCTILDPWPGRMVEPNNIYARGGGGYPWDWHDTPRLVDGTGLSGTTLGIDLVHGSGGYGASYYEDFMAPIPFLFEFDREYNLSTTWIWNAVNNIPQAAKEMRVYYSTEAPAQKAPNIQDDMIELPIGTFAIDVPQGPNTLGQPGPDFEGIRARYVLFNMTKNNGAQQEVDLAEVQFFYVTTVGFATDYSSAAESAGQVLLRVNLSDPEEGRTYTVDYSVTGGTAVADEDYIIAGGGPACWNYPTQCHGDCDNTGDVKGSDFLDLKNSWYACDPDANYNPCADFDRDGCVKGSDFLTLKSNWYQTVEANCPATGGGNTLVFNPGETSKTITIDIIDDGLNENDETIEVTLSNLTGRNARLAGIIEHTHVILDPRPGVEFQADSNSGSEDVTPVNVPVVLSQDLAEPATVDYAVTGGTAEGGGVDYTLADGTLTFNPGETTKNISIDIVYDALLEQPETIVITLSNQSANVKLGFVNQHTHTIVDPLAIHLKVDLALPTWGTDEPWPGTAKEGWWAFVASRWADMYSHDCVWEHDSQVLEGIDGTGIHALLSCGYEGQGGLHAKDLCRCSLAGDCPPSGSIQGDPIANTWYYAVDWGGPQGGDTVLIFTDLPAGTYRLKSYHNHWEPGPGQGSRNCCRCQSPMPPLPSITARPVPTVEQGCKPPDKPNYRGLCYCGTGTGVTAIQNAYNVQPSYVLSDNDVTTSEIIFQTDGSEVLIIYEAPDWGFADCARDGREGGRGILNAFELELIAQ